MKTHDPAAINLLFFCWPCAREESEPKVRGRAEADLGQKEAKSEKASEEELRHMEGGKTRNRKLAAVQKPTLAKRKPV